MRIINQHNKYIIDQSTIEKIQHLITHGYGCIKIDGTKVTYKDTIPAQDGDDEIIIVHVGDDEECEDWSDYVI